LLVMIGFCFSNRYNRYIYINKYDKAFLFENYS
jgi:hypothetical protein